MNRLQIVYRKNDFSMKVFSFTFFGRMFLPPGFNWKLFFQKTFNKDFINLKIIFYKKQLLFNFFLKIVFYKDVILLRCKRTHVQTVFCKDYFYVIFFFFFKSFFITWKLFFVKTICNQFIFQININRHIWPKNFKKCIFEQYWP